MKGWKAVGAASVIAVLTTFSTAGLTQDLHSQRATLEKDIAALNQQIATKQQQITALRNKPSPEQADVVAAQKTLDAARAELNTRPNPDSEGKVRNAEFKLKLAQLKFDKANDGIETLNDDIDKLQQQISIKQQQIKELNSQAAQQAQAQQQKLADERLKRQQQEQELARTRQEAEAAQQEIARLKAALLAQETAAAKTAAAKAAAASTPNIAMSAPNIAKSAAKTTLAAPSAAPTATTAAANANGLIKLTSQSEVLHQLQATTQLVAQTSDTEDDASLVLYLKRPGTKATNHDKISLRSLGNGQYRGRANVDAGQYEAVVGFSHWPVQFANSESGETTFLCDYRNKNAVHLVIYRSALEGVTQ